jgi:predicted nucleotidyltransferase
MLGIGTRPMLNDMAETVTRIIQATAPVDAIYLYGSRAKQTEHEASDWDIAIIFTDFETDLLARALRPQSVESTLERELKLYNQISVIDLETAPVYLQYSILMSAVKWFDRNVPHVKRVEQSIFSKWEKDYERYCLRTSIDSASTSNAANFGRIPQRRHSHLDRA